MMYMLIGTITNRRHLCWCTCLIPSKIHRQHNLVFPYSTVQYRYRTSCSIPLGDGRRWAYPHAHKHRCIPATPSGCRGELWERGRPPGTCPRTPSVRSALRHMHITRERKSLRGGGERTKVNITSSHWLAVFGVEGLLCRCYTPKL